MSARQARDIAASVRQRLANLARKDQEDFQVVLIRYGWERLLYRLSISSYASEFVLKGALLFQLWTGEQHRATRDVDLLGSGPPIGQRFEQIFRDICRQEVEDDGLRFRPETVRAEQIKEDDEYQGLRVRLVLQLGRARIPLQVDIGFGDAVTPAPIKMTYPALLDFPTPSLLVYPRETVVAEKFQAMVMLAMANSRMKDFFDLWTLAQRFDFRRRCTLPSDQCDLRAAPDGTAVKNTHRADI